MPVADEPIISVSGLRGVIGKTLTPTVAVRYACAFAAELPAGAVLIAHDGRTSGPMLTASISGALRAVGRDVIDLGVAATPTVGVMVLEHRAAGGIMVTASHNPPQYNGLKLFSAAGRVIPAADGQRVISAFRAGEPRWTAHDATGGLHAALDPLERHWLRIAGTVDVDRIRRRRFRVLLDSNHGAGSLLGRHLLEELGCEATVIGGTPDGRFEHPPEPTAENLSGVLSRVKPARADIGFCQDPDADRLAIIDERARYLGEEYTLAIVLDHVLRGGSGPIVTNCSTSRMSEDLASKYKVPFFRSAVGEANVVDTMLEHDALMGGEGNGGVIDPRVVLVRDSFVSMALVLDAMAARGARISELAEELPRYEIVKTKFDLAPEKIPAALAALRKKFADARADELDGLRLDWPDKWLLVRASNTEPLVRAIAEARSAAAAQELCDQARSALTAV